MAKESSTEVVASSAPAVGASDTEAWLSRQTGVELGDVDGKRVISITPELEKTLNVLVPVSQVVQINPHFKPNPRIIRLNKDTDAFKVPKGGKFALNKVGLGKLADLAQIELVATRFSYMEGTGTRATVKARMRGPDGVFRVAEASRSERYDLLKRTIKRQKEKKARDKGWQMPTADDIDAAYDEELVFLEEKLQTKAFLRCIRSLLNIKGEYSSADLNKPFFIIGWNFSPDASDPNVRDVMALQYRESSSELYGALDAGDAPEPEEEVRALGSGTVSAPGGDGPDEHEALEEAAEGGEAAPEEDPDPPPGGDPPDTGDPEEWDFDEGSAEDTAPRIPKPDSHFKPKGGPFAQKDVEEIVSSDEGRLWLAGVALKLKAGDQKTEAIAWLEWATNGELTEETLQEFVDAGS